MVERLVIGLLADGHVLLEGVPGLAKTLAVRTLARGLDASFSRIQFTPDLLPADLIGTLVFNPKTQEFVARRGPVFAHIVLADEINRAPAKVQSALLEAMQERQVTIGDETMPLPKPFLVLATQNPIEQEGTYPLPEAQIDRFLMKLRVGYPTKAEERQILDRMGDATESTASASVRAVLTPTQIRGLQKLVRELYADERIKGYLVELVAATREPRAYGLPELADFVQYGASPRATLALPRPPGPTPSSRAAGTSFPRTSRRRPGRPAPPGPPLVRGRGGERLERPGRLPHPRARSEFPEGRACIRRRMLPREIVKKIQRIRITTNRLVDAGLGGRVPLRLPRARHGVLRGPRLRPGRRRAGHRLERHGPHRRPAREEVRRGARPDRPPRRRPLPLAGVRLALPDQAGPHGRARRPPRLRGREEQRPRGGAPLHRPPRALHPSAQGLRPRPRHPARRPRPADEGDAHRPRPRAEDRAPRSSSSVPSSSSFPTSWRPTTRSR